MRSSRVGAWTISRKQRAVPAAQRCLHGASSGRCPLRSDAFMAQAAGGARCAAMPSTAHDGVHALPEGVLQMTEFRAAMATERDYSHRSTVQKLGVAREQRVEIAGDVGPGLRRDVKEAIGRGLVKSGRLDGAIVLVESEEKAKEAFVRYRPRLRDTGYLWMITRKRGHEKYLDQMALVPFAKRLGLIDNKTCSIDDDRSGIRFVIPRALRRDGTETAA